MFGRTIKLSIAKDNGRSTEFDAKRIYPDKQRCYECGVEGHLSYQCPVNVLGNREPPKKQSKNKHPASVNMKTAPIKNVNENDGIVVEDVNNSI